MLDKLIDLIVDFIDLFRFWEVVDEYEQAVVLRLGRFNRVLDPGFHWILPLGIERAMSDSVVKTTKNLAPQSLTTADGKTVVVSGIITRSISDIQTALLECESVETVIQDCAYGAIAKIVRAHTWEELHTDEFAAAMSKEVRTRAKEYGIQIHRVQLSDISLARSIRLWNQSEMNYDS